MARKLPVDVKKLLESVTTIGAQRDLPVFVDIAYDATASDDMIQAVSAAFSTADAGAVVNETVFGTELPALSTPCDLCVVVAGSSLLAGEVAAEARSRKVPAVVVAEEFKTHFSEEAPEQRVEGTTIMEGGSVAVGGRVYSANSPEAQAARAASAAAGALVRSHGIPEEDLVYIDLRDRTGRPFEELGVWIINNVQEKRLSMAADFEFLRHPLAGELTISSSIQNGAISVVFFMPGADMPLITLNQAKMVLEIAAVYGQPLDKTRLKEILVVIAGAYGLRGLARQLVRQVPGPLGVPLKAGIAFSGTMGMGYAAIDYFEEGGVLAGVAENAERLYAKADVYVRRGMEVFGTIAQRVGEAASRFGARQPEYEAA